MRVYRNSILKFDKFLLEREKYYLLYFIVNNEPSILYSDLKSYLIGRIGKEFPIWIWCSEDIDDQNLNSLYLDLETVLVMGNNEITCNRFLYDKLNSKYNTSNFFEMSYLTCYSCVNPNGQGKVVLATTDDREMLLKHFRDNGLESNGNVINDEEIYNEIDSYLDNKTMYLLKDDNNNILSICCYSILEYMAKLTRVYTPVECRKHGYCEWLVYNVTNSLINAGYRVLLYADHNYIPSRKAYAKIGYVEEDILITFTINKRGD